MAAINITDKDLDPLKGQNFECWIWSILLWKEKWFKAGIRMDSWAVANDWLARGLAGERLADWGQRGLRKRCQLKIGICHLPLRGLSHCSQWPSTHPERSSGWRPGKRRSVLWEKLAEQAFRELDIFRRRFYKPIFCLSFCLEEQ